MAAVAVRRRLGAGQHLVAGKVLGKVGPRDLKRAQGLARFEGATWRRTVKRRLVGMRALEDGTKNGLLGWGGFGFGCGCGCSAAGAVRRTWQDNHYPALVYQSDRDRYFIATKHTRYTGKKLHFKLNEAADDALLHVLKGRRTHGSRARDWEGLAPGNPIRALPTGGSGWALRILAFI